MRVFIFVLMVLATFGVMAQDKTLLVQVVSDQHGYRVEQMQVVDQPFRQTSPRPMSNRALRYQFLDARGNVIAEGNISDPFLVAAEFHGAESHSGNEGDIFNAQYGSFVLRVPYVESMVSLNIDIYLGEGAQARGMRSQSQEQVLQTKPVATMALK